MKNKTKYLEHTSTVKYLCKKFGIDFDKVKVDDETIDHIFLIFEYPRPPISFILYLDCHKGFPEVDLEIRDEISPVTHYFSTRNQGDCFSQRWIDKVIMQLEKKKNKLDYYIERLKIGSEYGISYHGSNSFVRDLNGLLIEEPEILYILKVMHIREGDNYRAFSYGIFDFMDNEWIIYPYCGSLDSGGGSIANAKITKTIEEVRKIQNIHLIELKEDVDDFLKFIGFEENKFDFNFHHLAYLNEFKKEGGKIVNLIESRDLLGALRAMRVLIDSMCRLVIKRKRLSYDYSKNDKLQSIFNFLCEKKVLSKSYIKSLESFLLIANPAQHNLEEVFWEHFKDIEDKEEFLLSALYPGKIIISHINGVFRPKGEDWLIE